MLTARILPLGFIAMRQRLSLSLSLLEVLQRRPPPFETTITEGAGTTTEALATFVGSTTTEAPTTTTEAACVATNVIQNSGFDSPANGSPWALSGYTFVSTSDPRSSPNHIFFAAEIGNGPIQQDIPNLDLSKAYQFSYYYTRGEFFDSTDCVITVKAGAALLDTNPIVSTSPKFLYTKRRFYVSAGTLSSTTIEINASCGNFNGGTNILVDDSMEVACHD
ncbi:uncharacterized protein BKA55DRAFT_694374 [Fusarium redolens]|uniref:Uncharacterized protein n=1 Tax=Fusarium redolens TaxID=48865 RepID=A0A9P9GDE4_FUSRE|nr:uncharacterized protein BKA55DRAFT_694374 [Fusarium redolens]KAH7236753.1 hypothetical protein BKA55DRAFT_694374 [Fusarium redolens]